MTADVKTFPPTFALITSPVKVTHKWISKNAASWRVGRKQNWKQRLQNIHIGGTLGRRNAETGNNGIHRYQHFGRHACFYLFNVFIHYIHWQHCRDAASYSSTFWFTLNFNNHFKSRRFDFIISKIEAKGCLVKTLIYLWYSLAGSRIFSWSYPNYSVLNM